HRDLFAQHGAIQEGAVAFDDSRGLELAHAIERGPGRQMDGFRQRLDRGAPVALEHLEQGQVRAIELHTVPAPYSVLSAASRRISCCTRSVCMSRYKRFSSASLASTADSLKLMSRCCSSSVSGISSLPCGVRSLNLKRVRS